MAKNAYNIENPAFEVLWRKLNRSQRQFVASYHQYRTKKACAEAIGITPGTVYAWPEYVWEAAELYEDHVRGAAWQTLEDSVTKATLIKAAGLDSEDERIQQMSATEILDRIFGKPKQRTEHTGEDGGAITVELVGIGGIDPDKDI